MGEWGGIDTPMQNMILLLLNLLKCLEYIDYYYYHYYYCYYHYHHCYYYNYYMKKHCSSGYGAHSVRNPFGQNNILMYKKSFLKKLVHLLVNKKTF